jgi:hypothetical protein
VTTEDFPFAELGATSGVARLDALELERPDHRRGQIAALPFAKVGMLEAPSYSDDPLWHGDLELQVPVVRDGHKLRVAWLAQDRVV